MYQITLTTTITATVFLHDVENNSFQLQSISNYLEFKCTRTWKYYQYREFMYTGKKVQIQ